jgi:hypothetical protein
VVRQLTYALRFQGEAERVGPDGNVLKTASTAPGCSIVSRMAATGLSGDLHPELGGEATLAAELTFTGATTFQETGTIVFGAGDHRLRFSTVGSGYLDPTVTDNHRLGAAIWRVDGGEGQFAGASGLIASAFFVDEDLRIVDLHLGVLFVP